MRGRADARTHTRTHMHALTYAHHAHNNPHTQHTHNIHTHMRTHAQLVESDAPIFD